MTGRLSQTIAFQSMEILATVVTSSLTVSMVDVLTMLDGWW